MWPAYFLAVILLALGIICGVSAVLVIFNGVDESENFGRAALWAATLVVIAAALIWGGRFILTY